MLRLTVNPSKDFPALEKARKIVRRFFQGKPAEKGTVVIAHDGDFLLGFIIELQSQGDDDEAAYAAWIYPWANVEAIAKTLASTLKRHDLPVKPLAIPRYMAPMYREFLTILERALQDGWNEAG